MPLLLGEACCSRLGDSLLEVGRLPLTLSGLGRDSPTNGSLEVRSLAAEIGISSARTKGARQLLLQPPLLCSKVASIDSGALQLTPAARERIHRKPLGASEALKLGHRILVVRLQLLAGLVCPRHLVAKIAHTIPRLAQRRADRRNIRF
ncbi:hypothetical protein D9M68_726420 [compost metagenome]